jgi:hypothetical protein
MMVRGVVKDEVGDHPHAAVAGGPHRIGQIAVRSQPRVDAVEVGDVVAVVALSRRHEGHQPHAVDSQPGEVVEPVDQARQVPAAITVRVEEGLDVQAVDDRVLPPDVAGHLALHPASSGRTRSPKASMKGRRSWPT